MVRRNFWLSEFYNLLKRWVTEEVKAYSHYLSIRSKVVNGDFCCPLSKIIAEENTHQCQVWQSLALVWVILDLVRRPLSTHRLVLSCPVFRDLEQAPTFLSSKWPTSNRSYRKENLCICCKTLKNWHKSWSII